MKAREIDESITNEVLPIIGAGLAAGARLAAPAIARGVSNLLGRGARPATNAVRQEPSLGLPPVTPNFAPAGSTVGRNTYNVQPGVPKPPSMVPSNMPTVTGPAVPRAASTAPTTQPAGRINMPSTQAPAGSPGPAAGGRPYTPVDPKSTVAPKPEIGTTIGRDAATTVPGGATTAQKAAAAAGAAGITATGIGTIGTADRGTTPPPAQGATPEPRPPIPGVQQPTVNPPKSFDPPGPDTDTSDRPGSFQDKLKAAQAQGWPDSDRLPPDDWAPMGTPVGRDTAGGRPDADSSRSTSAASSAPRAAAAPRQPQLPNDVAAIASQNRLANPNLIKPGQVLQLPGGGEYTVKPGDNLTKIAAQQRTAVPTSPALGAVAGSPPDLKIGDFAKVDPNASQEVKAAALSRDAQAAANASKNSVRDGPNPNIDQATRDRAIDSVPYSDADAERMGKSIQDFTQRRNAELHGQDAAANAANDFDRNLVQPKESLERILQLAGYKKYAGR